ncbi:MAG: FG-GAP-like repeat-containing protein, partial [Ilumatobacter sp.]
GIFSDSGQSLPAGNTGDIDHADVNNDGFNDLIVQQGNAPIVLLMNSGTGTFSVSPQTFNDPSSTIAVAFGDFDGDGDIDLAEGDNSFVTVWANNGSGVFADAMEPVANDYGLSGLEAVDVSGDGQTDLVLATGLGLDLRTFTTGLANSSVGTLGSSEFFATATADFNNDGQPELDIIAVGASSTALVSAGALSWNDEVSGLNGADSIAVGDFDGDGDIDVALGGGGVWLNATN